MPAFSSAKILEIFRSIQGEGPYMGAAQVFVRFFECNMHCVWCDTPASIGDTSRNYKDVAIDDLLAQVIDLYKDCHSVSITGGEPLLQSDFLEGFLPRLKKEGARIYLETNGTLPDQLAQVINHVDIVAMDIKLPSSTKQQAFWKEHEAFLKVAIAKETFLKTVISKDTIDDEVYQAVDVVKRIDPHLPFILQPNYFRYEAKRTDALRKCVELQKYCSKSFNRCQNNPSNTQVHEIKVSYEKSKLLRRSSQNNIRNLKMPAIEVWDQSVR
jgi:7-carboxy-7-deazaguanine synthase